MSGVKAKLKVVLQADDTVVAESEDAGLWQRILLAINKGDGILDVAAQVNTPAAPASDNNRQQSNPAPYGDDEMSKLARAIGTSTDNIQGACAPSKEAPYLTLDMHCWNTMKEQTPARGPGSVAPLAVAATLLALWKQAAKLTPPTQAECQKVLATINLRDTNAGRSVQASDWLQSRAGGVIVLNPARHKRAVSIAKAFCSQDWRSDQTWRGSQSE
jgi:hypothetical protein